ncbi:MAG TPA: hypothetical protein VJI46_04430 [Candidatus Nanoarchaeia archaeon]|nr:hypothetical protein [Candidatus Nanoarchaeia archaeon]
MERYQKDSKLPEPLEKLTDAGYVLCASYWQLSHARVSLHNAHTERGFGSVPKGLFVGNSKDVYTIRPLEGIARLSTIGSSEYEGVMDVLGEDVVRVGISHRTTKEGLVVVIFTSDYSRKGIDGRDVPWAIENSVGYRRPGSEGKFVPLEVYLRELKSKGLLFEQRLSRLPRNLPKVA